MLLVALVCLVPVMGSYLLYFAIPPSGRSNYGTLISPQRDVADFPLAPIQDVAGSIAANTRIGQFKGRWLLLVAAAAACDDACRQRLYVIRQVRLTTGKNRDRVERLWLVTDGGSPAAELTAQHPGMHVAGAEVAELAAKFPASSGAQPQAHIYLIDPLGHLMMRFPVDVDPNRMKKDLGKLLKISRIG